MLDFSDIKLGKVVVYNNQPCVITKCEFMKCQMRKPTKKCVMKSLTSGSALQYTYKTNDSVEEAEIRREKATFLYQTGNELSFMLSDTYETIEMDAEVLDDKVGYLKDGVEVEILYFNDNPISVDLPIKISFLVTDTVAVATGNTVSNVMKDATLETGMVVKVPQFIKVGEKIIMNTVEDEFAERDNK